MRETKLKRKRNLAVTVLLLPALVLMWIVGWAFYWIGHQKEEKHITRPAPKRDNVILIAAATLEEEPVEVSA